MEKRDQANIDKLFKESKTKEEIIKESKIFIFDYLSFLKNINKEETIERIKKEISFKGHKAWILIFSVVIASIGLNIGSTAIVVGAMLIMPLMGPIVGIGISVAINDVDTLKKSFINFIMIFSIGIMTAFFYFLLSPLTKFTPELEARTYPTILDVLVAIFGGLALVISYTRKKKMPSVIYGVAVATALMPPLCTAGYGLAVGNFQYFLGAFYLFAINSIFIALSAYIFSKLFKFPLIKYANSKRRKRIAQIATTVAIVVMVPSALLFWKLLQKEIFDTNVDVFVQENVIYEDAYMYRYERDFENKTITVYLGGEIVPDAVINTWRSKLENNKQLNEARLLIRQAKDDDSGLTSTNFVTLSESYSKNLELLQNKDNQIRTLESQIKSMSTGEIPFEMLVKEIKINYQGLQSISFSNRLVSDFEKIDTIPEFNLVWKDDVPYNIRVQNRERIKNWLEFKIQRDSIVVKQ
jgi:uncharacterized hydrophobic protein (TIGR00271 family)